MKKPNLKRNTRMQVLLPLCIFVAVVIIVLVIIIPSTADSSGKLSFLHTEKTEVKEKVEEETEEPETKASEASENTDSRIQDFFTDYYQAMSDGDTAAMDSMFDEEGYARTSDALSTLLDGYENIRIYTADGLHENELAAFVYSDVKFTNIDTLAPSVDSFYLSTADGDIKIMTAMYSDPEIAGYLTELSKKNPVKSIMENTEFWLGSTLQNDEALQEIYDKMQEAIASAGAEQ